jgi:hypothetical protein
MLGHNCPRAESVLLFKQNSEGCEKEAYEPINDDLVELETQHRRVEDWLTQALDGPDCKEFQRCLMEVLRWTEFFLLVSYESFAAFRVGAL